MFSFDNLLLITVVKSALVDDYLLKFTRDAWAQLNSKKLYNWEISADLETYNFILKNRLILKFFKHRIISPKELRIPRPLTNWAILFILVEVFCSEPYINQIADFFLVFNLILLEPV